MLASQGQGPAIDLMFYVSATKINTYGSCAVQEHYKWRHHVNIQFNKKYPQLAMQCNERWGHDFTRHREGDYSNP